MKWIIENGVFPDLQPRLMAELNNKGIEYKVIFTTDATQPDDISDPFDEFIFYGSWLTSSKLYSYNPHRVGNFFVSPAFDCSFYYPYLSDFLLNGERYTFVPGCELIKQKKWLLDTFFSDGKGFIRPDTTDTSLPGQLVFDYVYKESVEHILSHMRNHNELCVVATTRDICSEYRFLVAGSDVVCGSSYNIKASSVEMSNTDESWQFAQTVSQHFSSNCNRSTFPHLYVIDVAFLKDNTYKVLKLTSFSISDMYASNLSEMVNAVSGEIGTQGSDAHKSEHFTCEDALTKINSILDRQLNG